VAVHPEDVVGFTCVLYDQSAVELVAQSTELTEQAVFEEAFSESEINP
jgi:hypothetical protein